MKNKKKRQRKHKFLVKKMGKVVISQSKRGVTGKHFHMDFPTHPRGYVQRKMEPTPGLTD